MNNKVLKCILKYLPLYVLSLLFLFLNRYISSLTGIFVGQVLAIFTNEEHLLPGFLEQFVNNTSMKSAITSTVLIFIIISSINVILSFAYRMIKTIHCQLLLNKVSEEFYMHTLDIPKSEYAKRSTGDIIQRNNGDCRRIAAIFRNSIFELFDIVFSITTILYQIYRLNKTMFFISVIASVICLILSFYYGYFKIKDKELESSKNYSALNSAVQQSITNYSLVKSFSNEDYEYEKFDEINNKKELNNYYINNLHCKYWFLSDLLTSVYLIGGVAYLGYAFFTNQISLASISALIIIISSVLSNVSYLVNHITSFVKFKISYVRLKEYFDIKSEYCNDGTTDKEIEGDIEFNNVSMSYDNQKVLKNISFKIEKGQTLGVVGKSGSGKTSIINLLTRLDDYQEGSIKIDGIELRDYKKKCVRENIGVVLQDAYIFSKTIKENMLMLIDNDRVDLDMYIKRLSLEEDVNKFESGIETLVGERGVTLSGGQRQRISLLRTIIKNKKVLILDDTLSAVDNIVSRQIKETLKKEKATTIIISHNLLNVKDADKIIVLDEGKIVDTGTHNELINREGFYSKIWNLQQMIEEVK